MSFYLSFRTLKYIFFSFTLVSCIGEIPNSNLNHLEKDPNTLTSINSENETTQNYPEGEGDLPNALTLSATQISSTSAILSASIQSTDRDIQVYFEYGIVSKLYNAQTPFQIFHKSMNNFNASATISNLSPNTKYFFRVVVQFLSHSSYGSELSFKTMTTGSPTTSNLWGLSGELWDSQGRLQDFSYAGYYSGEKIIPNFQVVKNVKINFGAKGDGVSDDTMAFKNAISGTSNGTLFIPPGRYIIKDRLVIKKNNFILRGAGQSQTTLYFPKSLEEILGQNVAWKYGGGGLIWVGYTFEDPSKAAMGSLLAKVVAKSLKGESVLFVSNTSTFSQGQFILLKQEDQQSTNLSLWAHLHDGLISTQEAYGGKGEIYWPVEVKSVENGKINLKQPLRFDVRLEWAPVIHGLYPAVQESGIENLTIEFPNIPYEGHQLYETGYNGFTFRGALNSWMKNIDIKHADNGGQLDSFSKHVTLQNIKLISRSWKQGDYIFGGGYSGHHGISFGSHCHDNLLTDFEIVGAFIHDITVNHKNSGNVIRRGKGENINFDHHTDIPFANLFTDIDIGKGTRPWASSGGAGKPVPSSGAWETFWNVHLSNGTFPPMPYWGPRSNLVPSKNGMWPTDPLNRWAEVLTSITPNDLYQAQLQKRIEKLNLK